jgi:hypothetical protein
MKEAWRAVVFEFSGGTLEYDGPAQTGGHYFHYGGHKTITLQIPMLILELINEPIETVLIAGVEFEVVGLSFTTSGMNFSLTERE